VDNLIYTSEVPRRLHQLARFTSGGKGARQHGATFFVLAKADF
jgi:hypothetical protein